MREKPFGEAVVRSNKSVDQHQQTLQQGLSTTKGRLCSCVSSCLQNAVGRDRRRQEGMPCNKIEGLRICGGQRLHD